MTDKASVLVVDDNVGMVRTTAFILERKGYDVATARNGREALEKIEDRAFDMIFMDIKMPTMNGVETYRKMKEIQPDAKVIMITAHAMEELVEQAMEVGVDDILYKPLNFDRVLSMIEEKTGVRASPG